MAKPPSERELLRDATREAREALKDLKQEHKDLKETKASLAALLETIPQRIDAAFGREIQEGLTKYGDAVKTAINKAEERINHRYDTLAAIMMGEDRPTKESVATLVKEWRRTLPDH